jgi:hypothetical protein
MRRCCIGAAGAAGENPATSPGRERHSALRTASESFVKTLAMFNRRRKVDWLHAFVVVSSNIRRASAHEVRPEEAFRRWPGHKESGVGRTQLSAVRFRG